MDNRISNYAAYQRNYYEDTISRKDKDNKVKMQKNEKTDKKSAPELSDKAKALLEELQKKYSNMDFFIAEYDSDEEAASYLNRGTKEFSVLIDPETLEEMASDEDAKAKYLGILENATGQLKNAKEELGEDGKDITRMGVSIGSDGSVTFFAELDKMSQRYSEHLEKVKEKKESEKAEASKKEDHIHGKHKKTTVKADSLEELLEKIKNVDWDKIQEEETETVGSRFDLNV